MMNIIKTGYWLDLIIRKHCANIIHIDDQPIVGKRVDEMVKFGRFNELKEVFGKELFDDVARYFRDTQQISVYNSMYDEAENVEVAICDYPHRNEVKLSILDDRIHREETQKESLYDEVLEFKLPYDCKKVDLIKGLWDRYVLLLQTQTGYVLKRHSLGDLRKYKNIEMKQEKDFVKIYLKNR